MHYAPPGAQILLDQSAVCAQRTISWACRDRIRPGESTEVFGSGWPSSAGGRLVGSLSGLPYALAEAEQNFLIPSREQALIWGDLVPQMILMAKVPRWWNVTPAQTALGCAAHERGRIAGGGSRARIRRRRTRCSSCSSVMRLRAGPTRLRDLLEAGDVRDAIDNVTPVGVVFVLASEWWAAHKDDDGLLRAGSPSG